MLTAIFALTERSFRTDIRSLASHALRILLLLGLYISLCSILASMNSLSAPGLQFFSAIAYVDASALSLAGVGFFSAAISEEKEEDTLGLILMAGISPLGLLLGKSIVGLQQAMLLIAIQYPMMLLAVTMGGVSTFQVWALIVALLAYAMMLAGIGLFCSTISATNRRASTLMTVLLILFHVSIPLLEPLIGQRAAWIRAGREFTRVSDVTGEVIFGMLFSLPDPFWAMAEWLNHTSIFSEISRILTSGFSDSEYGIQFISNIAAGLLGLGLSRLFFRVAANAPSAERETRDLVLIKGKWGLFSAGRVWPNPFVWKDLYFVSGGLGGVLLRTTYFFLLPSGVCIYSRFVFGNSMNDEWITMALVFMSMSVSIDAARILASSLQTEVHGQTLNSLLMLPRHYVGTIYSKLAGAMLVWLPGPLIELGLASCTTVGQRNLQSFLEAPPAITVWLWFVMVPHVAAALSLFIRWGAVPLAIGLSFGSVFVVAGTLAIFDMQFDPFYSLYCDFLIVFACIGCHVLILLRVQALGAR